MLDKFPRLTNPATYLIEREGDGRGCNETKEEREHAQDVDTIAQI